MQDNKHLSGSESPQHSLQPAKSTGPQTASTQSARLWPSALRTGLQTPGRTRTPERQVGRHGPDEPKDGSGPDQQQKGNAAFYYVWPVGTLHA